MQSPEQTALEPDLNPSNGQHILMPSEGPILGWQSLEQIALEPDLNPSSGQHIQTPSEEPKLG